MGYINPVLKLDAAKRLQALPREQRRLIADLMTELRHEANSLAEISWRRRKSPIATYWRAVSTYARHISHCLRLEAGRGLDRPAADKEGSLL